MLEPLGILEVVFHVEHSNEKLETDCSTWNNPFYFNLNLHLFYYDIPVMDVWNATVLNILQRLIEI